jgi:ABC-type glutathione transport system ATPase component
MNTPLLDVADLEVEYPGRGFRRAGFRALKGVSIDVHEGETVGLVGGSGSGKTTLGRALLGLAPVSAGRVHYRGKDISHLDRRARRALGSEIQVIFQDPYSSLNPAMTIEEILCEPLVANGTRPTEARSRIADLLDHVALPRDAARRLPREFSGGQRQRIAIARALALNPRLIVCDEAVSALDLTTQARVLDLLIDIQQRTGVSYVFISHDLAVVRHISHRVAVLHHGEIVEFGDVDRVTARPEHVYTQRLLLAAPVPDPDRQRVRREERATLASAD